MRYRCGDAQSGKPLLFADPSSATIVIAKPYHVLFLCTGNSARSVLAESLLKHWGEGKFTAFSAGSFPKGQVNPLAMDLLKRMNMPTHELRSKSWDEYTGHSAPPIDFIFTVCDNAVGEVCPIWPGKPMAAHWGVADPAAVQGSELEKAIAFRKTFNELEARIKLFVNLPIGSLDASTLKAKLKQIGNSEGTTKPS